MSDVLCRRIYPELLKRLDDSDNRVWIAASAGFTTFVSVMPPMFEDTNVGHMAAGLLVHMHMDDADAAVQGAVCDAMCTLARVRPHVTCAELAKVRGFHRSSVYVDRVAALCAEG
jgi:hypothetical protein